MEEREREREREEKEGEKKRIRWCAHLCTQTRASNHMSNSSHPPPTRTCTLRGSTSRGCSGRCYLYRVSFHRIRVLVCPRLVGALLVHTIRSNRHATVFESTVYRWIKSPSGLPVSSIRSSDTFRELHIRATAISSGSFVSGTYLDLEEWKPGVARPGVARPV